MKQILPDNHFKTGFTVLSQKEHNNGERVAELGTFTYGTSAEKPVWKLCQWDSGPCLWANRAQSDKYTITDGTSRTLKYNPCEGALEFRLDTSAYYRGKPAKAGDYWPHLLIEQSAFREDIRGSLTVELDIRLQSYSETPIADDYVRAAQFLMFLYLKSRTGNDFVWFGLHFFDSRAAYSEKYIGYDGGKADASHALIYSIGEKDIFPQRSLWKDGRPYPSEEWLHVSVDMIPHIQDMIAYGLRDGYFRHTKDIGDLCVCGMNLGWETIATFDHTMEIKNLQVLV